MAGLSIGAAAGNVVGGLLFPTNITQYGPKLQDLTVSSSTQGSAIPFGYGTFKIAGMIGWCPGITEHSHTDKKSASGGGSVTTISYTYTASFQVFCGEGPGGVIKIWGDSKVLYDVSALQVNMTGAWNSSTHYAPGDLAFRLSGSGEFIFRSVQTNIGIDPLSTSNSGSWERFTGSTSVLSSGTQYPAPTIYNGTSTQMPDPLIEADRGAGNVSAHRGLIYFVYEDLPLTNFGNRIPNIQVVVQFQGHPQPYAIHVTPPAPANYFTVIDSTGTAYIISGTTVYQYNAATGAYLGILGNFGISDSLGLALEIMNDPVFGKWLFGASTEGGGCQAMAIASASVGGATPAPGTITNVANTPHFGGILYQMTGIDADSLGNVWTLNGRISSTICDLTKFSLYAATSTTVGLQTSPVDMNATYGWTGAGPVLHDPIDGTLILGGNTATGTGNIIAKYDPAIPAIVASRTDLGKDVIGENVGSDECWVSIDINSGAKYSAHDLHTVASYNMLNWTSGTFFGPAVYDSSDNVAWCSCGFAGFHQLGRVDLSNPTPSGYSIVLDSQASNNQISDAAPAISPDGQLVMCHAGSFVVFVAMAWAGGSSNYPDVIRDLCHRAGLTDDEIDTTQVATNLTGIYAELPGYCCTRPSSVQGDLAPVLTSIFCDCVESDFKLKFIPRGYNAPVLTIPESDLGWNSDKGKVIESIGMLQELPKRVTVTYMATNAEYQQGKQEKLRSSRVIKLQNEVQLELPMLLRPWVAMQIANRMVFLAAMERNPYTLNLWRASYLILDPSDIVLFDLGSNVFQVRLDSAKVGQDFRQALDARSHDDGSYSTTVTSTNAADNYGTEPPNIQAPADTVLYVWDLPLLRDSDADNSKTGYYFAESSTSNSWPGGVVDRSNDNGANYTQDASTGARAGYGVATTTLGTINLNDPTPDFLDFDIVNSVTVSMTYDSAPFESTTDDNVKQHGANAMLVGNEVIQYVNAHDNGDGTWTLSRLLRGRRNTDFWCNSHGPNETVIDLTIPGIGRKALDLSYIGQTEYFKGVTLGQDPSSVSPITLTLAGNDLKPASVIYLDGAQDALGNWTIQWYRRTRYGWDFFVNGVDVEVPLNEASEAYDVEILDDSNNLIHPFTVTSPQLYYPIDQVLADFGSPPSHLNVRVYQLSAAVGRGFPAQNPVIGSLPQVQPPPPVLPPGTPPPGSNPDGIFKWSVSVQSRKPNAGEILYRAPADEYLQFAANLPTAQAAVKVAPTSNASFPILQDGVQVGSVDFAAGKTVATFTYANAVLYNPGSVLELDAPAVQDATLSGFGMMITAARGVTSIGPPPPPPPPPPPGNYTANVTQVTAALDLLQLSDGAIQYTSEKINPYFANLACLGLVQVSGQLPKVKAWLQWYIGHVNDGSAGRIDPWSTGTNGTMSDWTISGGATGVSLNDADSTDSYGATALSVAWAYYNTAGSDHTIFDSAFQTVLDNIGKAVLYTQQGDGLTWAKPTYHIKYLQDNCEVYRGLSDLASLFTALSNPRASTYSAAASACQTGILTLYLSGPAAWSVYKDNGGLTPAPDGTKWYPDSVAQVFPVNNGVVTSSDAKAIAGYAFLTTHWPTWYNLPWNNAPTNDPFPWCLVAYGASLMADYANTDAYITKIQGLYAPNFPWHFFCAEMGWYIRCNIVMNGSGYITPGQVDMLTIVQMDSTLRDNTYLQGPNRLYTFNDVGNSMTWYIKGQDGFPWDGKPYDGSYAIYIWITENVWTDPHTRKYFNTKIPLVPRMYTPGSGETSATITDTSFRKYSDCSTYTTLNLGTKIKTTFSGPHTDLDFGGDVGKRPYYVGSYFYNFNPSTGTYKSEEQFFFCGPDGSKPALGWVKWHLISNGVVVNESNFNLIRKGTRPALVYPCGIP